MCLGSQWSCFSGIEKKYFALSLEEFSVAAPAKTISAESAEVPLMLFEKVEVAALYNQFRLVYRLSPYEINYYPYYFWVEKPEKLIGEFIRSFFKAVPGTQRVIHSITDKEPDRELVVFIDCLEEYDQQGFWLSQLKGRFLVRDFKTKQELIVHEFANKKKMSVKKTEELPKSISRQLVEELQYLQIKLSELK
jgi:hypothetical protein